MIYNFNYSLRIEKSIFNEEIKALAGKKIVLITSPTPDKLFGKYFRVIPHEKIIIESNHMHQIRKIADMASIKSSEILVAFGAGTCIDIAKVVANINSKYLLAIPTALSCNAFATNKSVVIENNKIMTIESKVPEKVIIDIDLIGSIEKRYVYSGLGDILSIYTAIYDWELAIKANKEKEDSLIMNLSRLILTSLLDKFEAYVQITDESIRSLSRLLMLSGYITNVYSSGRPESGSEHMFSRALEESGLYTKKLLHGEAVMLGILLCSELQGRPDARLYKTASVMNLRNVLRQLNIGRDEINKFMLNASTIRPERFSIFNTKRLDYDMINKITGQVMSKLQND